MLPLLKAVTLKDLHKYEVVWDIL